MKEKIFRILKYALPFVLAGVLLWLAFRGQDWKSFLSGLAQTRWGFVVLSVVAACVALALRALRWNLLLRPLDPESSVLGAWRANNIGNLMNLVVPGLGEFVRCARVRTRKCSYEKALGTAAMERVWDLLAVAVLLFVAVVAGSGTLLPFLREQVFAPFMSRFSFSLLWPLLGVVVLAGAAIAVVLRLRESVPVCGRVYSAAAGMFQGFACIFRMRGKLLFLACTIGVWAMYVLMIWLTFLAIPGLEHLGMRDALFISAVGNVASVVPAPGSLGAYHYIVGLAISSLYLGVSGISPLALLCATVAHGSHALLIVFLGVVSLLLPLCGRKKS